MISVYFTVTRYTSALPLSTWTHRKLCSLEPCLVSWRLKSSLLLWMVFLEKFWTLWSTRTSSTTLWDPVASRSATVARTWRPWLPPLLRLRRQSSSSSPPGKFRWSHSYRTRSALSAVFKKDPSSVAISPVSNISAALAGNSSTTQIWRSITIHWKYAPLECPAKATLRLLLPLIIISRAPILRSRIVFRKKKEFHVLIDQCLERCLAVYIPSFLGIFGGDNFFSHFFIRTGT